MLKPTEIYIDMKRIITKLCLKFTGINLFIPLIILILILILKKINTMILKKSLQIAK